LIVAFSPKSGKASQLVDKIKELDDRIQRNSDQLTGAQRDIRALQQPAGPDVHPLTDFTSRQAQLRNQIAALEQALVADRAKANTYAGELEAAEADSTNIESAVVGAQSLTTTILLQQRDQLSGP
jgi:chromosome segregation ATPase